MPELISDSVAREAADPATTPTRLAELAHAHPELRASIAGNPSAYDALREWIAQYPAPLAEQPTSAVAPTPATAPGNASLSMDDMRQRMAAAATAAAPTTDPREPTRAVPLHWGNYRLRYWISLAAFVVAAATPLIVAIVIGLGRRSFWSLDQFLVTDLLLSISIPLIALTTAIVAHPTSGKAKGLATIPAFFVILFGLDLGGVLIYAASGLTSVLLVLVWLIVRIRPAKSFVVLAFSPIAIAAGLWALRFPWDNLIPDFVMLAVVFGMVLLSRVITKTAKLPPTPLTREQYAAQQAEQRQAWEHNQRVAHLQQWESAYRSAHNGEPPPAGFIPPTPIAAVPGGGGTNVIATLALVFGLLGGLLGIIFGHIAHAQIRRTGEQGWGLATAGLVLGYVSLPVGLILLVAYYAWLLN